MKLSNILICVLKQFYLFLNNPTNPVDVCFLYHQEWCILTWVVSMAVVIVVTTSFSAFYLCRSSHAWFKPWGGWMDVRWEKKYEGPPLLLKDQMLRPTQWNFLSLRMNCITNIRMFLDFTKFSRRKFVCSFEPFKLNNFETSF